MLKEPDISYANDIVSLLHSQGKTSAQIVGIMLAHFTYLEDKHPEIKDFLKNRFVSLQGKGSDSWVREIADNTPYEVSK